jgi:plasmid stabilization system protein ParE
VQNFLKEVALFYERISVNPEIYQQYSTWRIAVLQRFPYKIVYQIAKEETIVLAVFHTRRNPERLTERK